MDERIGTVERVEGSHAVVRLDKALDTGERVGVARDGGERFEFRAQDVRIGDHPVPRGAAGQEVVVEVPPEVQEGDVLLRHTATLGSTLRGALHPEESRSGHREG
jgi:hypothetical protein